MQTSAFLEKVLEGLRSQKNLISQNAKMKVQTKNTVDEDSRYKNLALSSNQKNIIQVGSKLITAASKQQ